jgi:hypothetical protein
VRHRLLIEIDDHRHEAKVLEIRMLIDLQTPSCHRCASRNAPAYRPLDDAIRFFTRKAQAARHSGWCRLLQPRDRQALEQQRKV